MSFSHTPVLCREVLTYLAPERGGVFVDGTLGGGGHAELVLSRLPELAPPGPVSRLFGLMAERGRLPLLPQVVRSARRLSLEAEGGALGRLTCARPLEEEALERLKGALCRLHHLKKVELETAVDPGLLGGFRLELQGVTYDKSVRGGLAALARTLEEGRTQ